MHLTQAATYSSPSPLEGEGAGEGDWVLSPLCLAPLTLPLPSGGEGSLGQVSLE
jgi:hypothetical protein